MPKVKPVYNQDNVLIGYSFYCPGCGHDHIYYTNPIGFKVTWSFNGDVNNPTFGPSLLNRWGTHAPGFVPPAPEYNEGGTCHLFVQEGVINYCGDCSHEYNGKQRVPMKEY